MFEEVSERLTAAIDELEVSVDGPALVSMFGLLDRFTAKIVTAVGAFDEAEGWRDDGATGMTAWLRHQTRRSARDAARCTKAARRLSQLPVMAAAYREGTLSGGQVQAIVANLNDEMTPLFAEVEHEMVPILARLDVRDVSATMQTWAQCARDHLDDGDDSGLPERSVHLSRTLDGRRELSGSLDPEAGSLAECALRLATTRDVDGEPPRTPAHRRADALVDIFRFFLDHQTKHRGGRHRPHLNVFIDYHDLVTRAASPAAAGGGGTARAARAARRHGSRRGTRPGDYRPAGRPTSRQGRSDLGSGQSAGSGWLADGTRLDGVTIQRLACDAGFHRVVARGRSSILDYGWTTRNIPANLFNALIGRDGRCRFPGCDRPPTWCEAHHIRQWEHSGPTKLANLVLCCSRHHHLLHMPGWHIRLRPDATVEVTTPTGQCLTSAPPGQTPDLFTDPDESRSFAVGACSPDM